MKALVIAGSPRTKANSKAMGAYLQGRLERHGVAVDLFRLPARGVFGADLDAFVERVRASDAVVLIAPLYLNGLPASAQRLLEDLAGRKASLGGRAPRFYGVSHSGFPEPAQRAPEVRTLELFAREMGWAWQGALSLGGTSPIDGRPLEEAGAFAKVARKALDAAAAEVASGVPFSASTVRLSEKPSLPIPLRLMVWIINSRTRAMAKKKAVSLFGEPYRAG